MLRTVGVFSLVAMPAIGVAVIAYVLARSILDFRGAKGGRGSLVLLKAVGSLALWVVGSVTMFHKCYVLLVTSAAAAGVGREAHAEAVALRLIAYCVIYAFGGGLLAFSWWRGEDDDEPIEIFPRGDA
jgi:hypothetical protein